MNKIDEYLQSSEAEKNKKLHEIYGEWKVFKKPNKSKAKAYLKKDKDFEENSENSGEEYHNKENMQS